MNMHLPTYLRKRRRVDRWEIITRNDDFTDLKTDVPYLLRTHRPAVIGTQESKRTNYRAVVNTERYAVAQDLSNSATQGVAVILDRQQVDVLWFPRWVQLRPATRAGGGIGARGAVVAAGRLGGRKVAFMSAHRHPQRASSQWPAFDRALKAEVDKWKHLGYAVVLTMDTNVQGNKKAKRKAVKALAKKYGMRAKGVGLDAVFISGDLRFASAARAYRKLRSDHHPVGALIRWKGRK